MVRVVLKKKKKNYTAVFSARSGFKKEIFSLLCPMSYLYVMVALRMYEAGLHTESARNPVGATVTDS